MDDLQTGRRRRPLVRRPSSGRSASCCAASGPGGRRPPLTPARWARRSDRLAEFAARLLGTAGSQISLLTDDQVVAAGFGLSPGSVGRGPARGVALHGDRRGRRATGRPDAPRTSESTVPAPVTSGQVGAYLGAPLTDKDDGSPDPLRAFGPDAREWSDDDVATLRQLADSVVTELELSALVREYEGDRLRWGLAVDAAGIGTFDWDLVTGQLAWDDRLIAMFGYDVADFDQRSRRSTPACIPTTCSG